MKFLATLPLLAGLSAAAPGVYRRQAVSSASEGVSSASEAVSSVLESISSQVVPSASASASASAAAPSGSQDYATGLLAALRARDAGALASLIEPLAGQLVPILQQGSWSIFAPSDEALSGVDTSNVTALASILQYHVAYGQYPAAGIPENTSTIAATLLQGAPAVNLPNNAAQALPFTKDQFGTTRLIGQNASVLGNATYQNILIKLIDNVLTVPGNITAVLANPDGPNASALVGLVGSVAPDLVGTLASTAGLTVFAPSNAAVQAIAGSVSGVDPSAISSVIQGHVLPQVVYSTNITDGLQANSVAGTSLTLNTNATGVFVTGNNVTAQVVQTDFVAANGVVHVIDRVLFAPQAAASSVASGPVASGTEAVSSATGGAGGALSTLSGGGGVLSSATSAAGGVIPSATPGGGGVMGTATA